MASRHNRARNRHSRQDRTIPCGKGREGKLRIIGGQFRGRWIRYSGDPGLRPMKNRVREAVFNLIGPAICGKVVIDLFAGTGAMALEAISRGAERAIAVEQHFPTARIIGENAASLGVGDRVAVVAADAFFWARRPEGLGDSPWLVFCCPPYDFYVSRKSQMLDLIQRLLDQAPVDSLLLVEADDRLDVDQLPHADSWDVRRYTPAVVAVIELSGEWRVASGVEW